MSVAESSGLMRALRQLLPEASLSVLAESPWNSIAFAGTQLRLSADIADKHYRDRAANLSQHLSTHVFNLEDGFVADIAVTDCTSARTDNCLIVDVLLLDD
jgi:hypothetical protein